MSLATTYAWTLEMILDDYEWRLGHLRDVTKALGHGKDEDYMRTEKFLASSAERTREHIKAVSELWAAYLKDMEKIRETNSE